VDKEYFLNANIQLGYRFASLFEAEAQEPHV
jgi:hypothetical protein